MNDLKFFGVRYFCTPKMTTALVDLRCNLDNDDVKRLSDTYPNVYFSYSDHSKRYKVKVSLEFSAWMTFKRDLDIAMEQYKLTTQQLLLSILSHPDCIFSRAELSKMSAQNIRTEYNSLMEDYRIASKQHDILQRATYKAIKDYSGDLPF
jgi:hypothetical protein